MNIGWNNKTWEKVHHTGYLRELVSKLGRVALIIEVTGCKIQQAMGGEKGTLRGTLGTPKGYPAHSKNVPSLELLYNLKTVVE